MGHRPGQPRERRLAGIATDTTLLIAEATSRSPKDKRGAHELELDIGPLHELIRARKAGSDLAAIGIWHSHPTSTEWMPSTADFKAMEATHERANLEDDWQPWTGMEIATQSRDGSHNRPDMTAYATRRIAGRYETRAAHARVI